MQVSSETHTQKMHVNDVIHLYTPTTQQLHRW